MYNRNIYFIHDNGFAELQCGEHIILLDSCDVDKVSKLQWSIGTHGYATSGAGKHQKLLHRLVIGAKEGDIVDHVNHNKLDNRRCNLRICTMRENAMNRRGGNGNNSYKGICLTADGKWQAQINYNRHAIYLGRFLDKTQAAKAYDTAARVLYGEYAYLNFPSNNEVLKVDINHNRKLSWNEVESIRTLHSNGLSITQIAEMFKHSYKSIYNVVHNKTYKERRNEIE